VGHGDDLQVREDFDTEECLGRHRVIENEKAPFLVPRIVVGGVPGRYDPRQRNQ
jgi:hypothetical protein